MTNSPSTIEQLVDECQGLVRFLARRIHSTSARLDLDDLVGYGQIGLLQAARDFDSERGVKFSTFAYYRIRGAIYDGVNKLQWFRTSRNPEIRTSELIDAFLEGTDNSSAQANSSLAAEAGWFASVAASLAVIHFASDEDARPDEVVDQTAPVPWAGLAQREARERLLSAMNGLSTEAATLMRAVYFEDRTLQEAADKLAISKSWASRLHARSLEQLARLLKDIAP